MITSWIKGKDNKTYPIRFSQSVSFQLGRAKGIPMNMLTKFLNDMNKWGIDDYILLYFYAFKAGAKAEGQEFDMDEESFMYWILDGDETIMPQIVETMLTAQPETEKKQTERVKPKK